MISFKCILCVIFLINTAKMYSSAVEDCIHFESWDIKHLPNLIRAIIPEFEGKKKGEAGRIAIVGGSTEYTGAPYFAAISSLKVGADLSFVITTAGAAPVIKSYSPDLIVIPHTSLNITSILHGKDVVVLGPGLGRTPEALNLAYSLINTCKEMRKPLVIDADGLYAIYKNATILKDYPSPGAILTPNKAEIQRLKQAIPENSTPWKQYWGNYVTVLEKGQTDHYHSSQGNFDWSLNESGSGRRAGGQGDILSGALGTFLNWGLKSNFCVKEQTVALAHSIATFAAAKFTRTCNFKAYAKYGRSMIASDMLNEIHSAYDELFT